MLAVTTRESKQKDLEMILCVQNKLLSLRAKQKLQTSGVQGSNTKKEKTDFSPCMPLLQTSTCHTYEVITHISRTGEWVYLYKHPFE